MELKNPLAVEVPPELIEAIHALPARREVEHCGSTFAVSPFDIYALCPRCGTRLKVRSFAAVTEIEDVFDAVFEWMMTPAGHEAAALRLREMAAGSDR